MNQARLIVRKYGVAFVLVVLILFSYALRFTNPPQLGSLWDDGIYLVLGESFATGHPYRLVNYPTMPAETTWPPGYPLFVLAPAYWLLGPSYTLLRATSLILALANIVLLYLLFKPRLQLPYLILILGLYAVNNRVVGSATVTMSETSFVFFLLVFLVCFDRWFSERSGIGMLILGALSLYAAIWIRYWGISMLAAAGMFLLWHRKWREALALGLGFALFSTPFIILISSLHVEASSLFAVRMLSGRLLDLAQLANNISISAFTYWRTIPFVMIPVLGGPKTLDLFSRWGIVWVIDLVNLGLFSLVGIGLWQAFRARSLFGWYTIFYLGLVLVLTGHFVNSQAVFDEPRYTEAILPFLYFGLVAGLQWIGSRLFKNEVYTIPLITAFVLVVCLILVGRNVQQARLVFPLPELAAGAEWIQGNTDADAVIMTCDPVHRYLYFRRRTVEYPDQALFDSQDVQNAFEQVDYVMICPPLMIAGQPNNGKVLPSVLQDEVVPILIQADFPLVFEDPTNNVWIYKVP